MKIKRMNKKLLIVKTTIASLDNRELSQVNGGDGIPTVGTSQITIEVLHCPTTLPDVCITTTF